MRTLQELFLLYAVLWSLSISSSTSTALSHAHHASLLLRTRFSRSPYTTLLDSDPQARKMSSGTSRCLLNTNAAQSARTPPSGPSRPAPCGATYTIASELLGGQHLRAGDEVGEFWLGSTIVLASRLRPALRSRDPNGQKRKVGEAIGRIRQ
ncbi:hypothetical protein OF846_003698 [Rhodotorula toruloides]|nr:hypothetical protein OF846_003698 [Rhodotorula toruloides]